MLEKIKEYFPELTDVQVDRLVELETLVREWNEKINVISRKDTDNILVHHILHSMAIAKVKQFKPEELVLDVGTGGGFPGIPLAIMFPEAKFTLVDSIEKKIKVVKGISESLGLANVEAMKMSDLVSPGADFIMLEVAEGDTVDRYLKKTDEKSHMIAKTYIGARKLPRPLRLRTSYSSVLFFITLFYIENQSASREKPLIEMNAL